PDARCRRTLRDRERRADARALGRGARGIHHGAWWRPAALGKRPADRRRAGAVRGRRRAGAPDRLPAPDRARRAARPTAALGRGAAPSPSDDAHLEHDRGHADRRAGRADQDRGLRDGGPGRRAVRAWRPRLPPGGDAGELRSARGVEPGRMGGGRGPHRRRDVVSTTALTAMQLGRQSGETCPLVSGPAPGEDEGRCPRCDEALEFRKPASLQRTTAYVLAAAICYVPANLLPVLTTTTAAGAESDTIMQGVVLLWSPTGWPLSILVLVATVMIPVGKIVALAYLPFTVGRGSIQSNTQRVRLYRMVRFIGRWSMVDVFVDTFTAALIQLQPLMSVEPGPGLFFFAAVVVLTMLGVETFDPRLIWDAASVREVRHG